MAARSLPPEQRQFPVDQAAEFAFFGELLRLGGGFVEQGDGFRQPDYFLLFAISSATHPAVVRTT